MAKKQDIVAWIKTTPWLKSKAPTVQVPPPVLQDLVDELEKARSWDCKRLNCMERCHKKPRQARNR